MECPFIAPRVRKGQGRAPFGMLGYAHPMTVNVAWVQPGAAAECYARTTRAPRVTTRVLQSKADSRTT